MSMSKGETSQLSRLNITNTTGPILESKGMGAIFQKKGKGMLKKSKIFENLGGNVQNLKIFCKKAGDCMR